MSMNPILTKQTVEKDYIAYLKSILTVRDPELNRLARAALKPSAFVKGPYLEATPPFRQGKSLADLSTEGLITREFERARDDFHFLRPLYAHQEEAVRKICGEKANVIVATGTGSGKTECYFYPIFNALMREKENGELTPGVRALLLFPMNALANDQLKKLRQLLRNYPWISFGRYTGETPDCPEGDARRAFRQRFGEDPLKNEMLSRERMRQDPPHILLTNYAMLEYLLLRPNDSSFFDGHYAGNWKFIVLDEAHTYRGSNGSEIAMLMRRLKQRIMRNNTVAPLCIATSATLGSNSAKQSLADFATSIFGEQFDPENIVTSKRADLAKGSAPRPYAPGEYEGVRASIADLAESQRQAEAYRRLLNDERIAVLHEVLAVQPTELGEAADKVFSDLPDREDRSNALVSLIELATVARPGENSASLLSARYHLFIRSLEGMFASFYPQKQVYLDRREQAFVSGKSVKVFELANCERCHQEYIIGKIVNNELRPVSEIDKPDYFLVADGTQDERFSIDDEDEDDESGANCERFTLCSCCGHIRPFKQQGGSCCEVADSGKFITVYRVIRENRNGAKSDACLMCGGIGEAILRRFLTANHAATFVASDSLYGMIPPKSISLGQAAEDDFFDDIPKVNPEYTQESGRKLLIFSDNRQEAAYFAGFLEKRHQQIAWRRLMIKVLKRHPDGLNVNDLMDELALEADRSGLFDEQEVGSRIQKQKLAQMYAMREFLSVDRATGLEGRGYIEVFPEPKTLKNGRWGGDAGEAWRLIRYCMDTLRQAGAVVYPDSVPATDEFFAPRNHEVFFRTEQRQKYYGKEILAFLPNESRSNKRLIYVQKFLKAHDQKDDRSAAMDVLRDILNALFKLEEAGGYLFRQANALPATCYVLNYRKWKMRLIESGEHVFRCNRCGRVFAYEIGGICPELRCEGKLIRTPVGDVRNDPYYERQFCDTKIVPMKVREHTAQLSKEAAGDYQRDFEEGKINVLSCSTTFEMGVDVGDLEATFLRNVPPETANYIQRAGRAGRRASSTAFAVTFARRNSHDLNYFNDPPAIISGKIKPPYVEVNNDKIALRHVSSVVFAWFFRLHEQYFREHVGVFCGYGDGQNALDALRAELALRPQELLEAIRAILPAPLYARMEIDKWAFAELLVNEDGVLARAIAERKEELDRLTGIKRACDAEGKPGDRYLRLINTYKDEEVLSFLASSGVLPKYGFPIDVVQLKVLGNSEEAQRIELSRDLRVAIAEYAPPSEVVANGRVWTSYALNTVANKAWPEHAYYECHKCGRISFLDAPAAGETDEYPEKDCLCGERLKPRLFVIPIFGFSTSFESKPRMVGDSKPKHAHATRVQFRGIGDLDSYQQEQRREISLDICGKPLHAEYSPNGQMVVLNRGHSGAGLWICQKCGYVSNFPMKEEHKNKFGEKCWSRFLLNRSLGHSFGTDILMLTLPVHFTESDKDRDLSLVYAILEGASVALGIAREDINGCVVADNKIVLFDVSAGGAGHVRQIFTHLQQVLEAAAQRVSGQCGCSEETSCYGCLRNYGNQFDHEKLGRGVAYEYLSWLLEDSLTANLDAKLSCRPGGIAVL